MLSATNADGTKRKVVVKKAGTVNKPVENKKPNGQKMRENFNSSNDGMTYNPFAALLKK